MITTTHLHPMIVHFPIVLLTFAFIAEIISLYCKKDICFTKAGFYLLLFGTLGAIGAVVTGSFFTSELTGEVNEIKEKHELFANITMYMAIIASGIKIYLIKSGKTESQLRWLVLSLMFLCMVCVSITGFFGGNMVYDYMIGI
jgi:uncharacterized membrane protein